MLKNLFFILFIGSTSIAWAQPDSTSSLMRQKPSSDFYLDDDDTVRLYTKGFKGLTKLDSQLSNFKVFVTGENHSYTESNARLWLKMIKYLNQNAGVRNIMFEYGYSYGFLVNEYLRTGDTTLYNSIDQFAYNAYSNALKDLKVYNDSLPADQKLYFTAIDIERGVYPIVKTLDYLIPNEATPHDSIYLHIQSIKSLAAYNDFKLDALANPSGYNTGFNFKSASTLNLVKENFKNNEKLYQELLGDNYSEFRKVIIDNYNDRKQWLEYENDGAVQEYIYRENYMHARFLQEQETHPGNWFGQFGRCHTTQSKQESNSCEWFQFSSLADRIKNTSSGAFKDKVMTIGILYNLDRRTGPDKDSIEKYFDKYFTDVPKNSIALLNLSNDSTLKKIYGKDFNYFFLNTYSRKGDFDGIFDSGDSDKDGQNLKFIIAYNAQDVELAELNASLSQSSGEFNNTLQAIEIMFLGGAKGLLSGSSYGFYLPQEVILSNGLQYNLRGFYIKDLFYYNVTKKVPWVDLMPGFTAGYSRLKLTAYESANGQGTNDGFLGEIKNTVYTNPAFVMDAGVIADFNIKRLSLGYMLAYNFDFSKPEWKSQGVLSNNSPSTKFNGLITSFRIGVNF